MTVNKRTILSLLSKFGSLLVLAAIVFGSVNCTAVGMGVGATVGTARQPAKTPTHIKIIKTERNEFGIQEPVSKPMSVGGHVLVGGITGLVLDAAAVAALSYMLVNADYECDGVPHC